MAGEIVEYVSNAGAPGASVSTSRGWSRREVLRGAGVALGALALPLPRAWAEGEYGLPEAAVAALGESPLVYISPLKSDSNESSCHGEVWFFHDRGDVVIITSSGSWKARALDKGLDRARIWVGNFGPVSRAGDRYRSAPSFETMVVRDSDEAAFERLMASFGTKYSEEWGKWEPRFREGYADGSRIVIRYKPVGA